MNKVPVAIFLFKRKETLERIFERIREYAPEKVYLIGDGPRNSEEEIEVLLAREHAESLIDWQCDIIRNYTSENRGVYKNIGLGASWVLEKEDRAIFLEDDSLPEQSFFPFCEELLDKYKDEERIFWICGTNYLKNIDSKSDYVFTQHMLPCGWASWSEKFLKYYDGDLKNFSESNSAELRKCYPTKALFEQDVDNFRKTKRLLGNDIRKASWDRQVAFSLRFYNLLGVSPSINQIRNIGVDNLSTHGGNSLDKTMTKRFCELETGHIKFPLKHPDTIEIDKTFESKTEKIILLPFIDRLAMKFAFLVKPLFGISRDESLTLWLKDKMSR
ncbi:hypothetical protein [Vibrio sinaloensis]|uniref:hypothetical protein n=2 Tax=Photobacterium sp. (strain ATCC 43367) TaxID=379097 RepID=UPI002F409325